MVFGRGAMQPAHMTFLFQEPALLILVLLVVWVLVWLGFVVLRQGGVKSATPGKRKIVTWISAIVFVLAPLPLLRVIGLVVLIVGVVQLVAYFVIAHTDWGRRTKLAPRIRSRLGALRSAKCSPAPLDQLPWYAKSWIKRLGKVGFISISSDGWLDEVVAVNLLRPSDGTIAIVWWQANRLDNMPLPSLQLLSVAVGRAGALSTSVGHGPDACQMMIAQVSQSATPPRLLMKHDEGRRLLEACGMGFEVVSATSAPELIDWLRDEMLSGLEALPADSLLRLRKRICDRSTNLGSHMNDPATVERIEQLRMGAAGAGSAGVRTS
jgi:hypothetical protein